MSFFTTGQPIVIPDPDLDKPGPTAPTGSVTMYAGNSPFPEGYLLCDGQNILQSTYSDLYSVVGNIYSAGPTLGVVHSISPDYSYASNTITLTSYSGAQANNVINVGSICSVSGAATPTTGVNINGLPFLVTSAPALGTIGTFNGTFITALSGTGSGTGGVGDVATLRRLTFQVPDITGLTVRGVTNSSPYQINQKGGADTTTLSAANLPAHAHKLASIGENADGASSGGIGTVDNNGGNSPQLYSSDAIYNSSNAQITASGALGTSFSVLNSYISLNFIIKT